MNHLWQSTVFAGAAALVALALRSHRAETRFWVWMTASLKFLMPFSWLIALGEFAGSRLGWSRVVAWGIAPPEAPAFLTPIREPISPVYLAPAQATAPHTIGLPAIVFAIWICGAAAVVASWCVKWLRMRRIVREASPADFGLTVETRITRERIEPGVVGILRPVLMLPDGIRERLTPAQLQAIFAHELHHLRRRDNFFAFVHMIVEAIFWFHPLVWWIGARLIEERERACDEEVLRQGNAPEIYATSILRVCEWCLESPAVWVAGVTGADLKKRIGEIACNRAARTLSLPAKIALAMAGSAAIAAPVLAGFLSAPLGLAQTAPASAEFDVASIKPAAPGTEHFMFGVRHMPGGRISALNATLKLLITNAYDLQNFQLSGGPGWIDTARYDIEAKPDSPVGPNEWKEMLQNLLVDRFQLAFHRETKELPVYALVLARKDGKLGPGMVEPKAGGCTARDFSKLGPPGPGQLPFCDNVLGRPSELTGTATTVGGMVRMLSMYVGRKVIDKTGLTGKYDITLKFTPDDSAWWRMPGAPPPRPPTDGSGPSLFTALQEQLGLKLEPQKAPVVVFVIDRAEKPTEN